MREGDCVLQPPTIRHRVLESSDGLEVVEVSCPAEHETLHDATMDLPTGLIQPQRLFGGQLFLRHQASTAAWVPSTDLTGFETRDLGIAAASKGVGSACVLRNTAGGTFDSRPVSSSTSGFYFVFVLRGTVTLAWGDTDNGALRAHKQDVHTLGEGDSFAVPAGSSFQLRECAADLELLRVVL